MEESHVTSGNRTLDSGSAIDSNIDNHPIDSPEIQNSVEVGEVPGNKVLKWIIMTIRY